MAIRIYFDKPTPEELLDLTRKIPTEILERQVQQYEQRMQEMDPFSRVLHHLFDAWSKRRYREEKTVLAERASQN